MSPTSFLTALRFLTILPLPRRQSSLPELGQAVGWFPLVGLGIGAFLAVWQWLLHWLFPPPVSAVLVLGAWILLSGAIHFDGFLDSCDGLFGGRTPAQRLEIMRDHRVGAFAVAGGGILLLLKASALASLSFPSPALLLAPTLGRWVMSLAIILFPYAREQGLGRAMKDHAGTREALLSTLIALALALALAGVSGLAALVATGLTLFLIVAFIQTRIPGLTGDSYGALNELAEAIVLLAFVALAP